MKKLLVCFSLSTFSVFSFGGELQQKIEDSFNTAEEEYVTLFNNVYSHIYENVTTELVNSAGSRILDSETHIVEGKAQSEYLNQITNIELKDGRLCKSYIVLASCRGDYACAGKPLYQFSGHMFCQNKKSDQHMTLASEVKDTYMERLTTDESKWITDLE